MRKTFNRTRRIWHFIRLVLGKTPDTSSLLDTPPRSVLLLSFPRSGTSWIGSLLENFGAPFINYGELFACLSEAPGLGIIAKNYQGFRIRYLRAFVTQRRGWNSFAFENAGLDPSRVLEITNRQPGTHVIKIFPGHLSQDQLEILIKNYASEVVFLRRNHFDRLASLKTAQQTGNWQNTKFFGSEIALDRDELKRFTEGYTNWYRETKKLCLSIGLPVIDVAYEDLFDERNLHALLEAISGSRIFIPDSQILFSSLSKQRPREIHNGYEFPEWTPESSS